MSEIIIALENLRSLHNIGAIYRTAEFFGVKKMILIGYSAYDPYSDDLINKKLSKTALGTLEKLETIRLNNVKEIPAYFPHYCRIGVEQNKKSIEISKFKIEKNKNYILLFGNEVDGLTENAINISDTIVEIPRIGSHKSLNVEATAAIITYLFTNIN